MHSRILYWFRTPPGVKVGRSALDEDAIRLIEESNPDVEFDWTRILRGQEAPAPESRPQSRRAGREARPARSAPPRPGARELKSFPPHRGGAPPGVPADSRPGGEMRRPEPAPTSTTDQMVDERAASSPAEPAQGTVESLPPEVQPPTAAHARIGSEGVLRLRARYAELLARISERTSDAARREELKSEAERLNPDTWVTDEEVRAGLEQYEAVFASLRNVLGPRRRRRGRNGPAAAPEAPGTAAARPAGQEGDSDGSDGEDREPGDR